MDVVELRTGVGVGVFVGSHAAGVMPINLFFGPIIERGATTAESIWGIQLIPELGLDVLMPFSALSGDETRLPFPVNGLVGLRVLWGFGRVSVGASGHLLLGGIGLVLDDEEGTEVWRFSTGLRAAFDIDFLNGGLGFELYYTWTTEFQDVSIHAFTLSFFIDLVHLIRAFSNWTP